MGEKYYKPILNDGDHLVRSKDNKSRVRDVSQDSNNKTTDIVEWEEVEIETEPDYYYEPEPVQLSHEEQELAEVLGHALAEVVIYGAELLNEHIIKPWWRKSAKPWIKKKASGPKHKFSKNDKHNKRKNTKKETRSTDVSVEVLNNAQLDEMLNREFESIRFDMTSDEAKEHIMKLIYHMLGTAYEIKILSNTRIIEQVEDDNTRIENQKKAENLLAEKVANNINDFLSNDELPLDVSTSKQLFTLLGGGIRLNDEYVPVEIDKVNIAIDAMKEKVR